MSTKLIRVRTIKGQIEVLTGLHIGCINDEIEIGGSDNPIVKNPITGEPYIPGSSLKGKIRSLYEMREGRMDAKGGPCNCKESDCPVCTVFGSACTDDKIRAERKPTRIIVRDSFMTESCRKEMESGQEITELKAENAINRITSKPNLRNIERVLPGIVFDFEILFREYSETDEELLNKVVFESMKMLENDALGGGGSRGNGKVKFKNVTCDGESVSLFD